MLGAQAIDFGRAMIENIVDAEAQVVAIANDIQQLQDARRSGDDMIAEDDHPGRRIGLPFAAQRLQDEVRAEIPAPAFDPSAGREHIRARMQLWRAIGLGQDEEGIARRFFRVQGVDQGVEFVVAQRGARA